LYIFGFWLLSLHDYENQWDFIVLKYLKIFIMFKNFLKNYNFSDDDKKEINISILTDLSYNGKTKFKFFNSENHKNEIFETFVFPFIMTKFNNWYSKELYTLSWLNDFI